MSFNWGSILNTFGGWFHSVISNPDVQKAGEAAVIGIGKQVLSYAGNPDKVREFANAVIQNATPIVGAIVAGTPAQHLVDSSAVPSEATTHAAATAAAEKKSQ
jgi:hypothetical protein